jgi:3-deoxy-D-manno-octulosonic-acid transferase
MKLFYQISVSLYSFAAFISSFFNPKAKQWIEGRKEVFKTLKKSIDTTQDIFWFHCASLGEFEQGKPIIEKLKAKNSNAKILITFFSPSGYELRKDYQNADYVVYLPVDTPKNAKQFLDIVNPKMAFFIKYEFWYNYLNELHHRKIPTYLISGVFRENQLFFKWYGSTHKKMLQFFTHFFVQNETSKKLLENLNFNNVTISGDTRLDRVYENSLNPEPVPLIKKFIGNKKVIIIGSSWQKEEKIIAEYIHSTKKDFKYIIAPHNINDNHIKEIEKLLTVNYIKYSDATYENVSSSNILIIDNIGILANTYQFTDIAFVGGGFTGALHNVLEAASFGNVILFGPKHSKFHEAEELITANAAYEINDSDDLIAILNRLMIDDNLMNVQAAAANYVKNGTGATNVIFKSLQL